MVVQLRLHELTEPGRIGFDLGLGNGRRRRWLRAELGSPVQTAGVRSTRATRKVVSAGHGISDSSGLSVGGGACVAVRAWGWWCAAASVVTLCSLMEEERVRPCRDRESTV